MTNVVFKEHTPERRTIAKRRKSSSLVSESPQVVSKFHVAGMIGPDGECVGRFESGIRRKRALDLVLPGVTNSFEK